MKRLVTISDIHFGALKTPSEHIYANLKKYFLPVLQDNDLLVICGDIFDRNLSLSNYSAHLTIQFFVELFKIAESKNITLRIVRGTFSHDRNQISSIVSLYKSKHFSFDFKYFDVISYEYLKKYNLRCIYIPDDLSFKSSLEVIQHIKSRISKLGWDKVDYVFCHGSFKHIFPPSLKHYPRITFEYEQFKDIVKKYVICGHIHVPSTHKNIIYTGSFDRLIHGEKGKKGFFIFDINKDSYQFVENKEAMKYLDFYIHVEDSLENILNQLETFIRNKTKTKNNRYLGRIRIFNSKTEYKSSILNFVSSHFPDILITFNRTRIDTKVVEKNQWSSKYLHNLEEPTVKNIDLLLSKIIKRKYDLDIKSSEIRKIIEPFL